jgi:hypothetical protein
MLNLVKLNLQNLEEEYYNYATQGKSKFYLPSNIKTKDDLNNKQNMYPVIAIYLAHYMNTIYKDIENNNNTTHLILYHELTQLTSCPLRCSMLLIYNYTLWITKKINRSILKTETLAQYIESINEQLNEHSTELKNIITKNYHTQCMIGATEANNTLVFSTGETLDILTS